MICPIHNRPMQLVCDVFVCASCYEASLATENRRSRPPIERRVPGDTPLGHAKFRGYGPKV